MVKTGILNTGETSGIPIIKQLLKDDSYNTGKDIFIDCPPGSSCSVIESIKNADYCVLVAEPSIFGAHNLQMVHELVKLYNKPYGAVLNKCTDGKTIS
jgi:MinD superfamily P-loop ATPase